MTQSRPLISIVSPVYREAANVRDFHRRVSEALRGRDLDVEFVFVDDGSPDNTLSVLSKIAEEDPRVEIISFSRNFGAIAACTAGLRHCNGDAAVLISADLQDPPELIPELIGEWRKNHDIVWAVRESRDDPWLKRVFARVFYAMVRVMAFPDYPKNGTDVGLFSRRVLDIFRSLPERDSSPFYSIYSFGFAQTRIPYRRGPRRAGQSGWPFWRRVKNAIDVVTGFSHAPLRFISVTGLLLAALAFLFGLIIVYRRVVLDLGAESWPSLAALMLFIGGVQIMFLGVIAEYIWRIGEHSRQRPRYIIARRIGGKATGVRPSRSLDPLDLDVSGASNESRPKV